MTDPGRPEIVEPSGLAAEAGHTTEEISLADRQVAFRMIKDLQVSIQGLTLAFGNVNAFAARTRLILISVIVALTVAVFGGGAAVFAFVRADKAEERSELNSKYLIENCRSANESRAAQRELWDYVIVLSSQDKQTKTEAANLVKFKAFVTKTFADRDCSKVVEGKVK